MNVGAPPEIQLLEEGISILGSTLGMLAEALSFIVTVVLF